MKHTFEFFEIEAGLYRQGQERYNEKKKKKKKKRKTKLHIHLVCSNTIYVEF